jgi:hypothetical protein
MSYRTIAAALALEDVSIGERLVTFSLASYADAEHQTFVGNPAAAARAGLSRSQYLAAREQLEAHGLISVAAAGGGRGRSSTLTLDFATRGFWREERINPQLFQAVLSYTRAGRPARVLLATLAALANDEREVLGVTTDEICSAAGLSDRTYRRTRAALLASGELVAESCAGGRGNTNRWRLADPRDLGTPLPARQRVAPARNARPLLAAATPAAQDAENPGAQRAREEGTREPEEQLPPTPLTGGAAPSRSRSLRTSSATAAANDSAPSSSRSTRSASSSEHRATAISLIGTGSAASCGGWSASRPSRSGSPRSSSPRSTRAAVCCSPLRLPHAAGLLTGSPARLTTPARRSIEACATPMSASCGCSTRSPPPPAPPPLLRRTPCRACRIPSLTRRPYDHHHTVPPRRT